MFLRHNEKQKSYKSAKDSIFHFSPRDISLKDDGFHGSTALRFTEWWYFDAVFDNGYSIQLSVRVLSIINNFLVIVSQRVDVYKGDELIQHNRKRYSLKNSELLDEYPYIKLDGNQVIKGQVNKDGKWVYDLSFNVNNTFVDLIFEAYTKGWKGINPGGDWWAVIFPRANVKGIIKIRDKEIKVQGVGYHDHNWDARASVAKNNLGWFWGKINFKTFTATWATIFKNRDLGHSILVVNENNNGYINILPKDIEFIGCNLKKNNRTYIPYHFDLKAKTKDLDLDVSMDVSMIHHVKKKILRIRYWRFHVSCKGSITANGKTEKVNETQIAEFLKFK